MKLRVDSEASDRSALRISKPILVLLNKRQFFRFAFRLFALVKLLLTALLSLCPQRCACAHPTPSVRNPGAMAEPFAELDSRKQVS